MGDTSMADVKDEESGSGLEGEQEFEVEAIVKKRETKGLKEYYVKWKGFPSSENTWEPEGNLESAVELVKKFEESQGEKKRGRPPKDEKTEADPQEQEDAV